jgi:hypothetical protein
MQEKKVLTKLVELLTILLGRLKSRNNNNCGFRNKVTQDRSNPWLRKKRKK